VNPISRIDAPRPAKGALVPSVLIDAWCLPLEIADAYCRYLYSTLSSEERRRAEQYRHPRDSRRFVVRRGKLRELLASRLGCRAQDVFISDGQFGKPFIEGGAVHFNVSHSNGTALYAFAQDSEIGCDLEWLGSELATRNSADMVLSPPERAVWERAEKQSRTEVFLRFWTCKEAWLKACGIGLEPALQEITVSHGNDPCFVALPNDDPSAWSLVCFHPAPGYTAAVAVPGQVSEIRLWNGEGQKSLAGTETARNFRPAPREINPKGGIRPA
jgi:4'-phosphopantetheinyl transferase